MKPNERLQAVHLIIRLLRDKVPLSHLITADETPFVKALCFGVSRYYYRLEALAKTLVNKPPKAIEVWASMLLGLYQLHILRIPDYAVVQETVALLEPLRKTWAKGLVNAVLRRYCREEEALITSLQKHPAFHYNHAPYLFEKLRLAWPDHWQSLLRANDAHPPMTLRINQQKMTTDAYLARLAKNGIQAERTAYAPHGIVLQKPCAVEALPGFSSGEVSVQDEAAQLAVSLLELAPGLRVLDACCAPGGKTCHILETQPDLAACVALDVDEKRMTRVRENLNRLHCKATLLTADALHPERWWDNLLFDRILLDAPCSATGVIRRHPDIKLLRTQEDIEHVTRLQQALLESLWPLLAPGGYLVYATCSVLPEENAQQIAHFAAAHSDCHIIQDPKPWGHATGYGWQILPGENNMDGFFYAVQRKLPPPKTPPT